MTISKKNAVAEKYLLRRKELISDPTNKMAVCLCVDASMSMLKDQRMDAVNVGIRNFIKKCREDISSADSVDLCIITFGGSSSRIIQEFSSVSRITFKDITAGGGSPLASAVAHALQKVRSRMEDYRSSGITSYKPWIIIMSDGECDSAERALLQKVSKEVSEAVVCREINVKCINMGDGEKTLSRFTPDGVVGTIGNMEIDHFFNDLSRSVMKISTSVPGEYDDSDILGI